MPISIVMPTYNGMKYLEQAIQSVQTQSYQEWELVISDDGSKDGTREFLTGMQDPRIKVYFQPSNLGIFGNLNFLFSHAGSEITQILCQDDYFLDSEALDRLMRQWSILPGEIAFLRCNHNPEVHSHLERYQVAVLPPIIRPEESDLLFFTFGCIAGNLSNVSVRTKAVEKAGWFRTDMPYTGDFEFWSRLGHSSPWALAPIPLTHVRDHQERASVTLNLKGEKLSQARQIIDRLYGNLVLKGYSATLLRLMATIHYTSRQRDSGVKQLIRGGGSHYLGRVSAELGSSRFSFGRTAGWLIYFGSLGGRIFAVSIAKLLLRKQNRRLSAV